jgi:hypothetical protein
MKGPNFQIGSSENWDLLLLNPYLTNVYSLINVSSEVIELRDGLTKQLRLQEPQKVPKDFVKQNP